MECKTAAPLLHLYLDRELDRHSVSALERHLDDCPECSRELSQLDDVRQAVRKTAPRYHAPAPLRTNVEILSTREQGARRYRPRSPWVALAASVAAAALVSFATVSWFGNPNGGSRDSEELLAHDLVSSHLRALAAASPVDVVSSDRHTVKPWFAGRIGAAPPVPDFAAQGFELIGGRIDYVGEERIAAVVYRHRKHIIDVYFMPNRPTKPQASKLQRQGYTLIQTNVQGHAAWMVSDLDDQELKEFERLLAGKE
ncbi:MAG: anti-sigma factor family protein [Sulfurifustis sp.]